VLDFKFRQLKVEACKDALYNEMRGNELKTEKQERVNKGVSRGVAACDTGEWSSPVIVAGSVKIRTLSVSRFCDLWRISPCRHLKVFLFRMWRKDVSLPIVRFVSIFQKVPLCNLRSLKDF
jgi:hypothetical protein